MSIMTFVIIYFYRFRTLIIDPNFVFSGSNIERRPARTVTEVGFPEEGVLIKNFLQLGRLPVRRETKLTVCSGVIGILFFSSLTSKFCLQNSLYYYRI